MSTQDEDELRKLFTEAIELGRKLEGRKGLTTNQGGIPHPELYERNHINLYVKKAEREIRKDQTFKVIQSLVKSGSISDSAAASALALHSTNNSLEEK